MQQLSTNAAIIDTPNSIGEDVSLVTKLNQQTFLPLTKGTALVVGGGSTLDQSEFNQAIEELLFLPNYHFHLWREMNCEFS